MARHALMHRHQSAADNAPRAGDDASTATATPGWATDQRSTDEAVTEVRPVRVSAWAIVGLVLAVVGVCATLTGLLAPEGFALGVLGVLAAFAGLAAARRPGVTGRGPAVLGVLVGLVAVVLAVLAMTGRYAWPNSHTNQISSWHAWLIAHWSWLRRW